MTTRACMGGFCAIRERCDRYTQALRYFPIERRCQPGQHDAYKPTQYPVIPLKEAA